MKKLFPILALSMIIGLLSSCIIVTEKPTHTITFYNDLPDSSRNDIFDWYAKDSSENTFAVSSSPTPVSSGGGSSRLRDLAENRYYVVFTFDNTTDSYDNDTFYMSDTFYLDSDKDFVLEETTRKYKVSVRSAAGDIEETEEVQKDFQIVDSEGNVFPLKKVE